MGKTDQQKIKETEVRKWNAQGRRTKIMKENKKGQINHKDMQ